MPSLLCLLPRAALLGATIALALLGSGCATLTGESTQRVSIIAVDAQQQPMPGMRCRVQNGAAEYVGDSPMHDVPVRRSASDLKIECRQGAQLARGTAISRGGLSVLQGVLPGGTVLIMFDHLTGYRYSYPAEIRVRAGEHLVFDRTRPRGELQAETRAAP